MQHNMYFTAINLTFVLGYVLCFCCTAAQINPTTVDQVIELIQSGRSRIVNLRIECTWDDYTGNKRARSESQQIVLDHIGRMRITYRDRRTFDGSGVAKLHERPFSELLDDGKLIVMSDYCPTCDENGKPQSSSPKGYRNAQISDRAQFEGLRPEGHRNPADLLAVGLLAELRIARQHNESIKVQGPNEQGVVTLEFAGEPDEPRVHHKAQLDPKRGWIVTRFETMSQGRLLRSLSADYQLIGDNIWMATKGYLESERKNGKTSKWMFVVNQVVVNDPNFDDTVFDLAIAPGTFVYDHRFKVGYRTGETQAFEEDLTNLAQQARSAREKIGSDQVAAVIGVWPILLVASVGFILAVILLARRRHTSKG